MTQEHTPEPWKIGAYGMVVARGEHGGIVIADVPRTDGDPAAEANARRIVACVNALAGIPIEAIESGVVAEALLAVVNATRAYLPPDGISEQECINRILEATDNPAINSIIAKLEASK